MPNTEDPQVGIKFEDPMCNTCKFNAKGFCMKFRCKRMEAPVDIFDCPEYEDKGREDAMALFGR